MSMTVGEALIELLEAEGVEFVFGIPGVHTVELYRGLARSTIRHVTPRHEQGAGFMADGYARVSGKPGVCLVITGPGLTNTITAMAQARQDSVPMLVISGTGRRASLGHGRGALHELPDQAGMMRTLALASHTLLEPGDLPQVIARAFALLRSGRPGPVHIEIPVDVMSLPVSINRATPLPASPPSADLPLAAEIARLCAEAQRPAIILGGGARRADTALRELAELLDAPVVTTTNARGLLGGHRLEVPASPSLDAVREMLAGSDLVLALGTEFGPTDFDMYENGSFPTLDRLVRVDIDAAQLARGPAPLVSMLACVETAVVRLLEALPKAAAARDGARRADAARKAAKAEFSDDYRGSVAIIDMITKTLPGCIIVGDSTQIVYAGNLYCEIATPGGWFNAATGFGALGYAPPAAIGAALAAPEAPVVCIVGDGGLQFTLAELGSAVDAATPVIFLVWNNDGYREIETFMRDAGIEPEGVRPSAPDFMLIAQAYGLLGLRPAAVADLPQALAEARACGRPALIELHERILPARA